MPNSNFLTDLLATTYAEHKPEIIDNISNSNLLLNTMIPKRESWTSGEKITHTIYYRHNTTFQWYSGLEVVDTTAQNNYTRAEFEIKEASCAITVAGIDKAKNRGKDAILSLMKAKTADTSAAVKNGLNASFYSDGTGSGSKEIVGLEAIIATTGTYGGISRSTDTYWQAYVNSTGGVMTLDMLRTANTTTARNNDMPDIVCTTATLRNKYESLLVPSLRLAAKDKGNLSFNTLAFNSSDAQFMYDEACPSGTVYFINTKYLHFYVDPDNWMSTTKFTEPGDDNQDAYKALMLTYCALTCDRPESQGKITSVTA